MIKSVRGYMLFNGFVGACGLHSNQEPYNATGAQVKIYHSFRCLHNNFKPTSSFSFNLLYTQCPSENISFSNLKWLIWSLFVANFVL